MEIVMISNTDNKISVSQTREALSGNWGKVWQNRKLPRKL